MIPMDGMSSSRGGDRYFDIFQLAIVHITERNGFFCIAILSCHELLRFWRVGVEIYSSCTQDKPSKQVPLLTKTATYQCSVVCLFFWSLLALHVQWPVSDFTRKLPRLQSNIDRTYRYVFRGRTEIENLKTIVFQTESSFGRNRKQYVLWLGAVPEEKQANEVPGTCIRKKKRSRAVVCAWKGTQWLVIGVHLTMKPVLLGVCTQPKHGYLYYIRRVLHKRHFFMETLSYGLWF